MHETGAAVLDEIVDGRLRSAAVADVRTYFTTGFTGARFERFDDGGDRPEVADTITASDLVAVSTLSITWRADTALAILETHRAELTALLAQVPHGPIQTVPADVLAGGSPAWQASALLRTVPHVGPTRAGKLLARKRPHLLPVYDDVVDRVLGRPPGFWRFWHGWFADPGHVHAAHALRSEIGGIDDVSLLRCLDVALWMHGRPGAGRLAVDGVPVEAAASPVGAR